MHPLTTYLVEGSFLGISVTSWLERDDASGEKENLNLATFVCFERGCSSVLNAMMDLKLGVVVREN